MKDTIKSNADNTLDYRYHFFVTWSAGPTSCGNFRQPRLFHVGWSVTDKELACTG